MLRADMGVVEDGDEILIHLRSKGIRAGKNGGGSELCEELAACGQMNRHALLYARVPVRIAPSWTAAISSRPPLPPLQ